MPESNNKIKIVLWGFASPDYARARRITAAMQALGWQISIVHSTVFQDSQQRVDAAKLGGASLRSQEKSQNTATREKITCKSSFAIVKLLFVCLGGFCRLIWHTFKLPHQDLFWVGVGGFIELPLAWILTRFRRQTLVFDPLYSLYDTVVSDRQLIEKTSFFARLLHYWEIWCYRHVDILVSDTEENAVFFRDFADLNADKIVVVPVTGESMPEQKSLADSAEKSGSDSCNILFFGAMIPLQGVDIIVRAAALLKKQCPDQHKIKLTIVGDGQTRSSNEKLATDLDTDITWLHNLAWTELQQLIAKADICLGIFSASDKASRVIATKIVDCLASGKPIITRDSPATRRVFSHGQNIYLVPAADPQALASAIIELAEAPELRTKLSQGAMDIYQQKFSPLCCQKALDLLINR